MQIAQCSSAGQQLGANPGWAPEEAVSGPLTVVERLAPVSGKQTPVGAAGADIAAAEDGLGLRGMRVKTPYSVNSTTEAQRQEIRAPRGPLGRAE